jgi:N4-gp56 family major capsid protein
MIPYHPGNFIHGHAAKLWSKKLVREALKQTFMSSYIGSDSNSGIQMMTEAQKDRGDTVYVGLRMQLAGAGVVGHNTLEGNEEDLTLYRDSVLLDEHVHAVRSNVRITQQRVPFEVREEMRMGLQDWWQDRIKH